MRSLLGPVLDRISNRAPIPLAENSTRWPSLGSRGHEDTAPYLRATRASGTLFQVVSRLSTSTASVDWHMHRLTGEMSLCERCREPKGPMVEDHLALRLWNKPNDFFTRREFMEAGQQHKDLTGETWIVIERDPRATFPVAMWLVRPDRMEPIPSSTDYLAGYIYKGPNGQMVPLNLDEVIFIRTADPDDPYRGLGPIPSIRADVESSRLSAEYIKNFFYNSAEPGGVIEAPTSIGEKEWNRLVMQWGEQHRGVSRAHRVAFLENGMQWKDRKYTIKDMDFASVRNLSRDAIMEAYGVSKYDLGIVDDINRATAQTMDERAARNLTIPRLDDWKQAANNDFLPLFGTTGQGVELVYSNPIPENAEQRNADLTARTTAWATLVKAGAHQDDAAEVAGIPPMRMRPPPVEAMPV